VEQLKICGDNPFANVSSEDFTLELMQLQLQLSPKAGVLKPGIREIDLRCP